MSARTLFSEKARDGKVKANERLSVYSIAFR
jgi:hypothetical protein